MLEAVNSVLQTAPLIRAQTEQASAVDSFAANPDRTQRVAPPQAPYVSLFIHVDNNLNKAVLQIRDSETGDVTGQLPSEASLRARASAAEAQAPRTDTTPSPQTDTTPSPQSGTTGGTQTFTPSPAPTTANESGGADTSAATAATAQQQAAFISAARAGNSNAGSVTLFA